MKWLLNLYPPAWQRRYRDEVAEHLQAESKGFRTSLDLIAGALDAWLNPQWIPDLEMERGERTMITASRCGSAQISKGDAVRSAGLMIGVTLVLTSIGVLLDKTLGDHVAIDALLYSTFFIALTISSRHTYLKPYSRLATNGMILAVCVGWYVFFLGVAVLGTLM